MTHFHLITKVKPGILIRMSWHFMGKNMWDINFLIT